MKVNELLREVVASAGLILDHEDCLMNLLHKDDGEQESYPVLSSQNFPFRLPTNKNINNMYKVEDGKPELQFLLFNPILEDDVRSDTESLRALVKQFRGIVSMGLYEVGILLINLVKDDKAVGGKLGLDLQKFLNDTNDDSSRVKEQVDKHTIDKWVKMCTSPDEDALDIAVLQVVRGGKIDGIDYNRVAGFNFPLFQKVCELSGDEEEYVNGIKLRKKDIKLFQVVIKHLLGPIDDEFTCKEGSSHKEYPSFICLMKLYYHIAKRLSGLYEKLEVFAQDTMIIANPEFNLDIDNLEANLKGMSKELSNIPTEKDILSGFAKEPVQQAEEPQEKTFRRPKRERPVYEDEEIQPYTAQVQHHQPVHQHRQQPHEMSDNEKLNAMFGGHQGYGYGNSNYLVQGGIVPENNMSRAIRTASLGASNDPNAGMYAYGNNFPQATYYGPSTMTQQPYQQPYPQQGYNQPMANPYPMQNNMGYNPYSQQGYQQPQSTVGMGNQFNIYG